MIASCQALVCESRIYQVYPHQSGLIAILVSIVSGRAGILCSQTAVPDPNAEQRQKLLNELLSTEEEYLADLQYIVKVRCSVDLILERC